MKKEVSKLTKLMQLSSEYLQKYPASNDPFALLEIVGIDSLLQILQEAKGREIEFRINYSNPFQPEFEGFEILEIAK